MRPPLFLAAAAWTLAVWAGAEQPKPFITATSTPPQSLSAAPSAFLVPTLTPAASPAFRDLSTSGVLAVARALDASHGSVDAELGSLDGGPLSKALLRAARLGRRMRLLVDPYRAESRAVGGSLAGVSPTCELRWCSNWRIVRRWMNIDGLRQWTWYSGDYPRTLSPTSRAAMKRFEDDWTSGRNRPPEVLRLNDQLQSLPDPREKAPHYVRRQTSAGEP